jgi:hypothetical protein
MCSALTNVCFILDDFKNESNLFRPFIEHKEKSGETPKSDTCSH